MPLKKGQGKPEKRTGISFEYPVPEFVPAACMYDDQTVLTKNGELMHAIKIPCFTKESIGSEGLDLREAIRLTLKKNIKDNRFSVWVHTIRRQGNLDPGGGFENDFSRDLNRAWKEYNEWNNQYFNEIYISILIEGKSASIGDVNAFIRSMYFSSFYKIHEKYLKNRIGELYEVTDKIIEDLKAFGSSRLKIYKNGDIYYSDYMRFYGMLMNLQEKEYPVDLKDIAVQIADHKLAFGYNMFQTQGSGGNRFGAIFSLKEYHEMPLGGIDVVLQLPMNIIVTQTMNFISTARAVGEYEDQYQLLKFSGAKKLLEMSGVANIIEDDRNNITDFGECQLTFLIYNSEVAGLEKDIEFARESFEDLGIVAPRLDVGLEDGFWSQLPGNFNFVSYRKTTGISTYAGFASLYNFYAGRRFFNQWGEALTLMKTAEETPFFLNFHVGNGGHTLLVGMPDMGKTTLTNFLLSESMKYSPRILYLDMDGQSQIFIEALGGDYSLLSTLNSEYQESVDKINEAIAADIAMAEQEALEAKMRKKRRRVEEDNVEKNVSKRPLPPPFPPPSSFLYDPFAEGDEDMVFLVDWLEAFVGYDPEEFGEEVEKRHYSASFSSGDGDDEPDEPIYEVDRSLLEQAVRHVIELPLEHRSLKAAAEALPKPYARKISPFLEGGDYADLFSLGNARKLQENKIIAFDVSVVSSKFCCIQPVLMLLMRDLLRVMDGEPCILVLDEAWKLFKSKFLLTRFDGLMEDLSERNGAAIISTSNLRESSKQMLTDRVLNKVSTRIFTPNLRAEEYSLSYRKVWKLTDEQYEMLIGMQLSEREFLVVQEGKPVVVRLNLNEFPFLAALRSSPEQKLLVQKLKERLGEAPQDWYPTYLDETFALRTRKL